MVLAYHVIFTAYGFWLPNDPRGSWSDLVRCWEILAFGEATTTSTRSSVAHQPHDRAARLVTKDALKYPPVLFNGLQAAAVGMGFAEAIREAAYVLYACAIMPDHVHLVVARHTRYIEMVESHLKAKASRRLTLDRMHPLLEHARPNGTVPSPWANKGWAVYLNSEVDIRRAITYVENNPMREGLRPQHWKFVAPYAG
jgi:REP element-mobilizing transposase RayT